MIMDIMNLDGYRTCSQGQRYKVGSGLDNLATHFSLSLGPASGMVEIFKESLYSSLFYKTVINLQTMIILPQK